MSKSSSSLFRLSPSEFELLSELTSRQFGYVRMEEEANLRKKRTAVKTVALLEQELAAARDARKEGEGGASTSASSPPQDATIYRKLGHLHLLLENFTRALSAYEKYEECAGRSARKDLDFLYGRGLVYFHFGAYHLACKTFQVRRARTSTNKACCNCNCCFRFRISSTSVPTMSAPATFTHAWAS